MKKLLTIVILLFSYFGYAQIAIENYSNASADQLPRIEQIMDWIQFHNLDNVYPLLSKTADTDQEYLNIESSYISKEYSRDKIVSVNHTTVSDNRNVIWYERDIYKKSKAKLKPRYQIYITLELTNNDYKIVDLRFGKKKKINTDDYIKN